MPDDSGRRIIEEFRSNGGRVGGALADTPMLLLHHLGTRSGIERVTPLAYTPDGDGRYLIVASNGGSPTHPRWYHNLRGSSRVDIEVGSETFTVQAEELEGDARAALWPKLLAASRSLTDYEARTVRRIPLLVLTRAAVQRASCTATPVPSPPPRRSAPSRRLGGGRRGRR